MILAIDPASKTGWCDGTSSGVEDFSPKKGDDMGHRITKFSTWLSLHLDSKPGINMVVYEKPGGRNFQAIRTHSHLECIIMQECDRRGVGRLGISASEIKKHATGKGNCDKAAMIASAALKWPQTKIISSDHADAMWIFDYAINGELFNI